MQTTFASWAPHQRRKRECSHAQHGRLKAVVDWMQEQPEVRTHRRSPRSASSRRRSAEEPLEQAGRRQKGDLVGSNARHGGQSERAKKQTAEQKKDLQQRRSQGRRGRRRDGPATGPRHLEDARALACPMGGVKESQGEKHDVHCSANTAKDAEGTALERWKANIEKTT